MDERQIIQELNEFKIEVANFTGRVTEWMESTKNYRQNLCDKLEGVVTSTQKEIDKLCEKLPCKENDNRLRKCESRLDKMEGKAAGLGAAGGFIVWLIHKFFVGK